MIDESGMERQQVDAAGGLVVERVRHGDPGSESCAVAELLIA